MATPLQYGDSLLLLGHVARIERLERNPNLFLVGHRPFSGLGTKKATIALLLLLGVVATAVTGILSPAISMPLAAMLALLLRCIKVKDAYQVVDWQAVVTVAGMIPFGYALEKTGAAEALAQTMVGVMAGFGPLAVMAALLAFAVALTQLIENAAVAIILAPVAYQIAKGAGVDPKPFMVGLAICVSAAFCTPVAHESTILVMGPGRYRFRHYLQVGGLLALLTWLIVSLVTPLVWPFRH